LAGLSDIAWILDLDGVVWLAEQPIPGAARAIERLDGLGEQLLFVTNFSALTKGQVEGKLKACGIDATGRVLTSAMAAASLVQPNEKVLVCAGNGVIEAVEDRGAIAFDPSDGVDAHGSIDAVIVGFHPHFDFTRLAASTRALHKGARLISTNNDPTYPTPDGLLPGNGSLTSALATAGQVQPTIAGKPNRAIADLALDRLETQRGTQGNLVVGDLPATDGLLAVELGFEFGLVLSGVTGAEDAASCDPSPYIVADDLEALVDEVFP
jgi:4-nitrophenyl phosphatase